MCIKRQFQPLAALIFVTTQLSWQTLHVCLNTEKFSQMCNSGHFQPSEITVHVLVHIDLAQIPVSADSVQIAKQTLFRHESRQTNWWDKALAQSKHLNCNTLPPYYSTLPV